MNFLNYQSLLFSNLSNIKTKLFSASYDTLLNAVNVCNKTDDFIRFSIMVKRDDTECFLLKNVLIQKNESKNLMKIGDLEIFLQAHDELYCFSDAYNHFFDCSINYIEYHDLDSIKDETDTTDTTETIV